MTDSYGRNITYLRLSVTDLCNLRCRYCMPEEGICRKEHSQMLTEDEMISAVKAAAGLGINKVRITGGEPLVKKNILSICENAAAVPGLKDLALTTNGTLLKNLAADLRAAGVNRLNISLDTTDPEKYRYITRTGELKDALEGIEAAFEAGFSKIKINSVLIGGFNDNEISDLASLTEKWSVDVRFIELMPMNNHRDFGPECLVSAETILRSLPQLREVPPDGGVARLFEIPGAKGRVGVISPVSHSFCSDCNKIRITSDGFVKPCLHLPAEYSIKGLDEEQMRDRLREAIENKPLSHKGLSCGSKSLAGRSMNEIGG